MEGHNTPVRSMEMLLQSVFGHKTFRPYQQKVIEGILQKRDVFALLPTGGGKSLCFQIPALMMSGVTVVISPLIALMKDQVDGARRRGIEAACINSTTGDWERRAVHRGLTDGTLKLLYIAPERFAMESFMTWLQSYDISLFALDEAHCISEWGHDFRPDYLRLSCIPELFPGIPMAAFTATATRKVERHIIRKIGFRSPLVVRAPFDRENLYYAVEKKEDTMSQCLRIVNAHRHQSGIIYRSTREKVMETSVWLSRRGVKTYPYHAGLSQYQRMLNQEAFLSGEVHVMAATIAFGMGIDKPDVRFIIHGEIPRDIESYAQETGRAGRDGKPGTCVLLYSPGDVHRLRYLLMNRENARERRNALDKLKHMNDYAAQRRCRRFQLLSYFGDAGAALRCEGCDVCAPHELVNFCGEEHLTASAPEAPWEEPLDQALLQRLRILRRELADNQKIPVYCVFHDRVLREICRCLPGTAAEFLAIRGVGSEKFMKYGEFFIRELFSASSRSCPSLSPP